MLLVSAGYMRICTYHCHDDTVACVWAGLSSGSVPVKVDPLTLRRPTCMLLHHHDCKGWVGQECLRVQRCSLYEPSVPREVGWAGEQVLSQAHK
jgi:hypothetical protein